MEFLYQAKSKDGKLLSGKVEASSEEEAVSTLHQRELTVLSLEVPRVFSKDIGALWQRIPNKELVAFTRQLATLVDADVPFVDSLNTLAKQTTNAAFKRVLSQIAAEVEAGSTFSGALFKFQNVFSTFFISLVKSGEASGKLHDVLLYLADYLERAQDLKSKIRGALAYPAFVLSAMVVVATFLMITVVPQLLGVLEEAGVQDLPLTTKILIFVSDFIGKFIWILAIVLIILFTVLFRYFQTQAGKEKLDRFILRLPILGLIARGLFIARLSESLSTLIKSGVPILDALRITGEVVGNAVYGKIISDAREKVSTGGTISSVFNQFHEIPPLVTQMISIGEKTGKIDFMLDHMAKFYKSQSEAMLQNLSTLLEPVLVLIIGVGVAILVASILLPIYNLVGAG